MVLAAQYESLRLPLAIILIVPLCLLFALIGVHYMGGDNNIFTQIGFIVLDRPRVQKRHPHRRVRQREKRPRLSARGRPRACRLRLRPILMTSIAFIAGVYPLVVSTGAGAEMRRAMGTAVFSGMIGVTFLGLFLTPVFYVLVMIGHKRKKTAPRCR
jgi:multidrug efflux pump subunit AcrB